MATSRTARTRVTTSDDHRWSAQPFIGAAAFALWSAISVSFARGQPATLAPIWRPNCFFAPKYRLFGANRAMFRRGGKSVQQRFMEDDATVSCPYCGKELTSKSTRSHATHVGMCRSKAWRLKSEREARAKADAEEQDAAWREDDAAAPATEAAPSQPLSASDCAWMKLFLDRGDVSCSLLDAILPLARCEAPQFSRAAGFFAKVDALPGPSFEFADITLPSIPDPQFNCAYRSLPEVVRDLVQRFNGEFLDPETPPQADSAPEFIFGERFRMLQTRLQRAAGDDAILMPLILSSGLFLNAGVFFRLPLHAESATLRMRAYPIRSRPWLVTLYLACCQMAPTWLSGTSVAVVPRLTPCTRPSVRLRSPL